MIFLATRKRLANIERFIKAYHDTKATEKVILLVDEDDDTYQQLVLPEQFGILYFPKSTVTNLYNQAFALFPNEDVYGIMADDVVPETKDWDKTLRINALNVAVAWGDDGIQGIGLPTHPFLNGDIVRKLGFIAQPDLKHWYVDDFWLLMAHTIGGAYCHGVKITHHHHLNGKAAMDDTYKNQPEASQDAITWKQKQPEYRAMLLKMLEE